MKRAHDNEIWYAVMETSYDEGKFVEFIPQLWLNSAENCILKMREIANFYFPRRSPQQTPTAPTPKKIVRKKKVAIGTTLGKRVDNSDSEDDNREVNTISSYNFDFATDAQNLFTLDESNNILPIELGRCMDENIFGSGNDHMTSLPIRTDLNSQETFGDRSSEMFVTLSLPVVSDQQSPEGSCDMDYRVSASQNNDLQNICATNTCKGHQKILNKIDYVQKKVTKDMGLLRQEVAANRKLLLQLLNRKESEDNEHYQTEEIQGETVHMDMAEVDEFNEKYKATFPITDCDFLLHFNNSLKLDQKFADRLFAKLDQIKGADETKTARKILKELCDFRCLKDFTWLGTKKMKSFQDLHLIVEMITKLLKGKYANCDAMSILTKVVQQRTKSAKEAWVEYLKKSDASTVAQVQASGADNNDKTESPITTDEEIGELSSAVEAINQTSG